MMDRKSFIRNIKLILPGNIDGQNLNYNDLSESVANSFESGESLLLFSPRQSGRLTNIMVNLLYEVYMNKCPDTIVISKTVYETNHSIERTFSHLKEVNTFFTKSLINSFRKKIKVWSAAAAQHVPEVYRKNKRLVVLDAAFINDKARLEYIIQGWDTVIMETISNSTENNLNALFIKDIINGNKKLDINILSYTWDMLFDEKWMETHRKILPEDIFRREILLEW